jgi:hypothetical protein
MAIVTGWPAEARPTADDVALTSQKRSEAGPVSFREGRRPTSGVFREQVSGLTTLDAVSARCPSFKLDSSVANTAPEVG